MTKRGLLATVSLAALAIAGALPEALAYVRSGPTVMPSGHHRLRTPTATAPVDPVEANISVAYGLRRLRTAFGSSNLIRLRRASDDLGVLFNAPDGDLDMTAIGAHCAATTCWVTQLNDQSGISRHLTQATNANQPQFILNCVGNRPCIRFTASTQTLVAAAGMTPTSPVSLSAVANRVGTTGTAYVLRLNGGTGNHIRTVSTPQWTVHNGTTGVPVAAADNVWHAATGVLKGVSSYITTDEVSSTFANLVPSVTAGAPGIVGATGMTLDWVEGLAWSNRELTSGEIAALQQNQRDYWMLP